MTHLAWTDPYRRPAPCPHPDKTFTGQPGELVLSHCLDPHCASDSDALCHRVMLVCVTCNQEFRYKRRCTGSGGQNG